MKCFLLNFEAEDRAVSGLGCFSGPMYGFGFINKLSFPVRTRKLIIINEGEICLYYIQNHHCSCYAGFV